MGFLLLSTINVKVSLCKLRNVELVIFPPISTDLESIHLEMILPYILYLIDVFVN